MDGQSLNITTEKIQQLKALFPEVFSEDKIDFQRLKIALGEDTLVKGEHYELSWAGKTEARKEIQKQSSATLIRGEGLGVSSEGISNEELKEIILSIYNDKILPRLDSLAESHELDQKSLYLYAILSQNRTIWTHFADEEGSRFYSLEHSRRAFEEYDRRIQTIFGNRKGVISRIGNAVDTIQRTEFDGNRNLKQFIERLRGDKQINQWIEEEFGSKVGIRGLVGIRGKGLGIEPLTPNPLPLNTPLTPNPSHLNSPLTPNPSHLFIEGENLEVLRTLQKSYFGKVKMIYIDPPYNTGNDSFVYPDNFEERQKAYKERAKIVNENGDRNSLGFWQTNHKENGQFHSVWLSMMYPRLYLSRNLLKEDGVIFISIDDNEASNLKLLCDEVFGEENFISQFIWQKTFAPKNDAKYISNSHESILCYTKNITSFERILLPRTEEANQSYTNPDNDERGVWTSTSMLATSFSSNYVFEIITPNGKKHSPPEGRCWRYSQEKIKELIKDNRIWFGSDGNNVPRTKRFLTEVQQGIVPQSLLLYKEVGSGQDATNNLKKLFDGKQLFDFSKPVSLIKHFLKICVLPTENHIILDFFAGSGTTAQAVMELNEEDGGNRQFICVQMPEPTDENSEAHKAGYKTIADITKARITKVIEQIGKERVGQIDFVEKTLPSFQHFMLSESNFKVWRSDIQGKEAIALQLFEHQQSEKNNDHNNLFTELCLKLGLGLSPSYIVEVLKDNLKVYKVENTKVWFFFEKYDKVLKEIILEKKVKRVIMLNSCFEEDAELTNFQLELKEFGIGLTII